MSSSTVVSKAGLTSRRSQVQILPWTLFSFVFFLFFSFSLSFFSSFSSFARVPLQSIINVQPFILIFAVVCSFIIDHNHRAHIQSYSNTTMHCHTYIDDHHLHVQPLPQHTNTTTYNHNHHIKIPPQPPPPHSASCNVCLFVCAHISKCASASMKNTTSASCNG